MVGGDTHHARSVNFYDKYVFAPAILDQEPWELFGEGLHDILVRVDPSVKEANVTLFSKQVLALRLEVIGLAWSHRFRHNDMVPEQSECTRTYLSYHHREQLYSIMAVYNQAVAESTDLAKKGTRTGRALVTFMNLMRADLFDKWLPLVSDPMDAARAANRFGIEVPWKDKRTHVFLISALAREISCKLNAEAQMHLIATIQGFFDGTIANLKKCKIII